MGCGKVADCLCQYLAYPIVFASDYSTGCSLNLEQRHLAISNQPDDESLAEPPSYNADFLARDS